MEDNLQANMNSVGLAEKRRFCRNSKVTMWTEPFRISVIVIAGYFMYPFMYNFGIDSADIGTAQSMGYILGIVASLLAATIVNRMGRKLTTILFLDGLGIIFVIGIYALNWSPLFLFLMFAATGAQQLGNDSYTLLMQEDEINKNRQVVVGLITATPMGIGIIFPLIGIFIEKAGLDTFMNYYLIFVIVFNSLLMFIRFKLYKETEIGCRIMAAPENVSVLSALKSYFKSLPGIVSKPKYMLLLTVYSFNFVTAIMAMVWPAYFLGKGIVTDAEYANLGFTYAIAALIGYLVIVPILRKKQARTTSIFITSAFMAVVIVSSFLLLKEGMYIPAMVLYGLYGMAFFFPYVYAQVLIVETIEPEKVSNVLGTFNFVMSIICVIMPLLFGYALKFNLNYGIIVCIGVWLINFGCAVGFRRVMAKEGKIV